MLRVERGAGVPPMGNRYVVAWPSVRELATASRDRDAEAEAEAPADASEDVRAAAERPKLYSDLMRALVSDLQGLMSATTEEDAGKRGPGRRAGDALVRVGVINATWAYEARVPSKEEDSSSPPSAFARERPASGSRAPQAFTRIDVAPFDIAVRVFRRPSS